MPRRAAFCPGCGGRFGEDGVDVAVRSRITPAAAILVLALVAVGLAVLLFATGHLIGALLLLVAALFQFGLSGEAARHRPDSGRRQHLGPRDVQGPRALGRRLAATCACASSGAASAASSPRCAGGGAGTCRRSATASTAATPTTSDEALLSLRTLDEEIGGRRAAPALGRGRRPAPAPRRPSRPPEPAARSRARRRLTLRAKDRPRGRRTFCGWCAASPSACSRSRSPRPLAPARPATPGSPRCRAASPTPAPASSRSPRRSPTSPRRIRTLERREGDVSRKLSVLEHDLALHRERLAQAHRSCTACRPRASSTSGPQYRALGRPAVAAADRPLRGRGPVHAGRGRGSAGSFRDLLDQLDYKNAIGELDTRISDQVHQARGEVRVARTRTKAARTGLAGETRVIAVRTSQVRSAHDQLVAATGKLSKSRAAKRSSLAAVQQSEKEFVDEANALLRREPQRRHADPGAASSSAPADRTPLVARPHLAGLGPVTSPFGWRWGRMHEGIDIGVGYGTPIHAAACGTVIYAGWEGGYGNFTRDRPRRRDRHRVRPPVEHRRLRRAARLAGPGDRLRRLHRPLLRPAPALRGAHQRHRRSTRSGYL